ncbi:MAG: DUF2721 domain-containing protein, partial [Chlorobiales bacterium]|nr:DUF2721 domain-containing protein [Chlorobiales bacterium]
LLLLSITNRYNHALDRTRQLSRELAAAADAQKGNVRLQLTVFWKRCGILRQSIGFVVLSVLLSSLLVLFMILHAITGMNFDILNGIMLVSGIMCIVISTLLFFVDVSLSLKALRLDLERYGGME